MNELTVKKTVAGVGAIALPLVCGALLSSCATDEYAPAGNAIAATPVVVNVPQTANYHALRASDLIGRPVRNARGDYLGDIGDLVLDMSTGDVRYAVISTARAPNSGGRLYAVPMRSFVSRVNDDMTLAVTPAELTRYRSWPRDRWPGMHDMAFWSDIDRVYGYSTVHPGSYYDRWSQLAGKDVRDARGYHVGWLRDLVVNVNAQKVHYAVVSFEPGVAAADRLYAVPLYAFMPPRDSANRLVLDMDSSQIARLESFDAAHWSQINEPAYVTRIDRYFVTAFPVATSFEQLDVNKDGFLSKAELAPLGLTTDANGRYVIRAAHNPSAVFHRLDVDHDGFLTRVEAEPMLRSMPGTTFDRLDTNRDGFLSVGEAMPALASIARSDRYAISFDELDRDRDGFLTKAEAAPLFETAAVAVVPRVTQPVVMSFDSIDRNHDGFISREEAQAALGADAAAFDRYDSNQDGFLSRAEADLLLQSGVGASSGAVIHRTIIVPR